METNSQGSYSFLRLDELIVKPPIRSNSVINFDPVQVAEDAQSTRIIVHSRFPVLVNAFLDFKREHGSEHEKRLYGTSEMFTWQDEVSRLIEKRPLVFMGAMDHTMLRNGEVLRDSTEWDRNGTDEQHLNKHLTLPDYLSYDEIMLSSLIGVSGQSYFINNGSRFNKGQAMQPGSFEPRGVIIGLVGARFERADRMDSSKSCACSEMNALTTLPAEYSICSAGCSKATPGSTVEQDVPRFLRCREGLVSGLRREDVPSSYADHYRYSPSGSQSTSKRSR